MYEMDYRCKDVDGIQIHTIGCPTSENDAISFAKTLIDKDSIIISTCYFVKPREEENLLIIDLLRKIYPTSKFYVIGCGADYLRGKHEGITYLNNNELDNLLKVAKSEAENNTLSIKIQDGCANQCTFCLIRKLRGKLSSTPYKDIKKTIEDFLKTRDYVNLDFCGIELTHYYDKEANIHLAGLVRNVLNDFDKIKSIHLGMSLDPFSKDVIELIHIAKDSNKFNHPISLAIQSCSDSVLKRMKRKHTSVDIRNICQVAKEENVNLAWQVIAGFPGETEEEFNETLEFVKEWKPHEIEIFPFSPRENTEAFDMPDQIDEETKCRRVRALYEVAESYNLHKHSVANNFSLTNYKNKFKAAIFENDFIKIKFNPDNLSNVIELLKSTHKDCIIEFDYKEERDQIYINFFKEFLPEAFLLVKSDVIDNKELFENQFHCIVI